VRRAALLVAISGSLLFVAACGGSALPPPLAGDAPSAAASSPGPGASPLGGPPAASGGAPSAPPGFTDQEAQLLASIRADARVGCVPRREDLPPKATHGVECTVGSDLVGRVGVYGFTTPDDALAAYVSRMASYGVPLRSGDCLAGSPGDSAWAPGDGPAEGGDLPWRTGCFHDENGKANVRVTCGLAGDGEPEIGRYIGILGASTKIRPLLDWATTYEEGVDVPVPTPPGICMHA